MITRTDVRHRALLYTELERARASLQAIKEVASSNNYRFIKELADQGLRPYQPPKR